MNIFYVKKILVLKYIKTKKIDEIILDNPKGGFCDFCCVDHCIVYHDKKMLIYGI